MPKRIVILGGGVTGLAAGIASGGTILEKEAEPGGLCRDYVVNGCRLHRGGGHWLFGGDRVTRAWVGTLAPTRTYERDAAVYFSKDEMIVPYPIQKYASLIPPKELPTPGTMNYGLVQKWANHSEAVGQFDLYADFFDPFHERYTDGLYKEIAPQDEQKTPVDGQGYNSSFMYPQAGMGSLISAMATKCELQCGWSVGQISPDTKNLISTDGHNIRDWKYDYLISTLPLPLTAWLAGYTQNPSPPYTRVVVFNVIAEKGPKCPKHHWLYVPDSDTGCYRVGFYSNVEPEFLPEGIRQTQVRIYGEQAIAVREDAPDMQAQYNIDIAPVVQELQRWGFIGKMEYADFNMCSPAYTWHCATIPCPAKGSSATAG